MTSFERSRKEEKNYMKPVQNHRKTTWQQNNMAVSIEKSRDMQMRNCDVISHVTALDQSEPSTHLTRSAPGDNITAK